MTRMSLGGGGVFRDTAPLQAKRPRPATVWETGTHRPMADWSRVGPGAAGVSRACNSEIASA